MPEFLRARSVLAVQELERSRRFYIDVLGFTEDAISNHSWYIHLLVDDVDAYHREVRSQGAEIVTAPTNRAYGLREFTLCTPDGHRLMVGQAIATDG